MDPAVAARRLLGRGVAPRGVAPGGVAPNEVAQDGVARPGVDADSARGSDAHLRVDTSRLTRNVRPRAGARDRTFACRLDQPGMHALVGPGRPQRLGQSGRIARLDEDAGA